MIGRIKVLLARLVLVVRLYYTIPVADCYAGPDPALEELAESASASVRKNCSDLVWVGMLWNRTGYGIYVAGYFWGKVSIVMGLGLGFYITGAALTFMAIGNRATLHPEVDAVAKAVKAQNQV